MTVKFHPTICGVWFVAMTLALISEPAMAEAKNLTGAEIKTTFTGARAAMEMSSASRTFLIIFKADGMMDGEISANAYGRRGQSDRGKWWVEGDRLCRKWDTFADGKAECFSVRMNGVVASLYRKNGSLLGNWRLSK